MGSKTSASAALFLSLNLLFFALVTATDTCSPKSKPTPTSIPAPTPSTTTSSGTCPMDALKLGVCANLLGGLIGVIIGNPLDTPCCSLIEGLVDLEAAVCLCIAIKANVLGVNLNIPVSLSLLVNTCGKKVPSSFQCA